MEEAPPPPPAEQPHVLRTSDETDAMTLAAVHPYGHEVTLEISRTEFESFMRDGFYFEEDTLEELPQSVDPMIKEHRDPNNIDLEAPRLAWYHEKKWKNHQDTVYWVDIQLAQQKGLKFYETRSNAIILYGTFPACCIPKVGNLEKSSTRKYMRHLPFLQRFP